MALLPFDFSYVFLTPKRVRLPGEAPTSPSSPTKPTSPRAASVRWSSDITTNLKSRSLRSFMGAKYASVSPPAEGPNA
ncbi:hypothetical protein BJ165DRAFT_1522929 [Panaeolus papilionaceus]|nr:hypothetical protein BJ165DRAFT_1522929 [Panaeolus papilionaceus]